MPTTATSTERRKRKKRSPVAAVLLAFIVLAVGGAVARHFLHKETPEPEPEPLKLQTMYVASPTERASATMYDEEGQPSELVLIRGMPVQRVVEELIPPAEGEDPERPLMPRIQLDEEGETFAWIPEENLAADLSAVVTTPCVYARRTMNLLDEAGIVPGALVQRGDALTVTGYDGLNTDGSVDRYRVEGGYIRADLVAMTAEATAVTNADLIAFHAARGDAYGGGDAGELDYEPWDKPSFPDNPMPDTVKALYLNNGSIDYVEDYIAVADGCGINAFVVDILDGGAVGYASPVMQAFCPSAYENAYNSLESYQRAIARIREAGYYVVGRITTFNDPYLAEDHPECVISDTDGAPLMIGGMYWPSVFDRRVWQYKVDLALEAVERMGFNEIQFDYVRCPDGAWRYEDAGNIDYHNTYGESKAQAIQRFLAYAAGRLHDREVYMACDVFGECAMDYVTSYGQYWPAISAVADVISAMPYPDHYGAVGEYLPWEHPYDTLYAFGTAAMARQGETPGTPARVRTWIQAYNAIREPYTPYGPDEVGAEIQALIDAGCTGGYMTWHGAAPVEKYAYLMPAFQ